MISIIIPLYNVENYVIASLKSALNQTFPDIEYLLIDDCSSDCTMQVVEEYISTHPRRKSIKIIHHKNNRGPSAARNTGLKHATGEFVFFMDSDDEITPDCIEKHYETLSNSNAELCIADFQLKGAKSVHVKPMSFTVNRLPLRTSFFRRMWNVSAGNKLYRKEFLSSNDLTFQDGIFYEDVLWAYKIASMAKKAVWVNEATYIYKVHKNSRSTSKNSIRKIESLLFILHTIRKDWEAGCIPAEYENDYLSFMGFWRLNAALLLLNYDGSYKDRHICYSELQELEKSKAWSLHSFVLKLPFWIFYILVSPIYIMYKARSKIITKLFGKSCMHI